ncbi:MAG: hypothetical protein AAGC55_15380, partial [Myxococcota bacterium]
MVWRKKDTRTGAPVFRAPPGFRDSGRPIFGQGEVVNSTYQIRQLLHGDDGGQVFEAWDMLLERTVALKSAWRDDDVPPLLPEARAPSAIGAPCVADVYGIGNHRGAEFLVAERIDGMALIQHVSQIYQDGELLRGLRVIELLSSIAQGLVAVHRAGYSVDRLSSANTIISESDRLVFAPFALGQGQLDSKPPVFAPEIVTLGSMPESGSPAAVAVDLYALGCIAVELCTAKPPFPGESVKALRFAHIHHRPPQLALIRDDLPIELSDLVEELMA